MYGYIYKTINLINNKFYIGQKKSNTFLQEKYLGSGIRLKSAIQHYGKENFKVILIDIAETKEELDQKEIFWITFLNANDLDTAYNLAKGGDGNTGWCYKGMPPTHLQTPAERQKRSESLKKAYAEGRHSRKMSDEGRKKMSERAKNRPHPPTTAGRRWMNNGIESHSFKPEDVDIMLEKGWVFGRLLTTTVWNKGLTKETDPRVAAYAEKRKQQIEEKGSIGFCVKK